jgi:serine/threonine-protein kinase
MDENSRPAPSRPGGVLGAWRDHRVYGAALGYLFGAWAVLQVAAIVLPGFGAPPWVLRALMLLLAFGLGVTLLVAWSQDRRAKGLPLWPRAPHGRLGWALTACLPAALVAGFFLLRPPPGPAAAAAPRVDLAVPHAPAKSVAVLPFDNFSTDQDSEIFAEAVQDEVLTDLARIADLKVISRSSVMQYKDAKQRNLREIGRTLDVAYLVEGSVQRGGNRIKVTAQLIDARTDTHHWADEYVRDLSDVFAIQGEIARAIAAELQAHLSPDEQAKISERQTGDVGAYEHFVAAKGIVEGFLDLDDQRGALFHAADLLQEACRRDPNFVEAYCYAARTHDLLFFIGIDPTPARRALAEAAIDTALRLRPDSGDAHLARADFYLRCDRDFARAGVELALARPSLPNSAPLQILSGYLDRRLGHWEESTREFERACALDPHNANALDLLFDSYVLRHRFADAERAVAQQAPRSHLDPREVNVNAAAIDFHATGRPEKLAAALREQPAYLDPGGGTTPQRIIVALAVGDYAGAQAALDASPLPAFQDVDYSFYYPRAWYEAQIARAAGDQPRMRTAFAAARHVLEERPEAKKDDPRLLAVLAQVDAGLGNGELALREAQHAVERMPISRDAYDGPLVLQGLAQVYVWTGDYPHALDAIETLVRLPGYLTYGYLRADPMWSPLRDQPRFQAILASLAPGA